MGYLGDFGYGATIYVPFNTYDANGASVTLTGLAVTDIEIYKNGSATQRASDNGYTLLDTDGIDFDGITGIHGFSIDTSDNSTAGFFGPGNDYMVVVASVTVDTRTVNFVKSFSIENRHTAKLLLRTTIATLANQTSFTLTAGSADDDAYNGCEILIQDAASTVQKAVGVVLDYTGSTKTVTLLADPAVFTMAATDYVAIYADRSLKPTVPNRTLVVDTAGLADANVVKLGPTGSGTAQTARDIGASVLLSSGTGTGQVKLASGYVAPNWGDVGNPTTTLNLSGTTVKTATDVETDTQDIQSRLPAALTGGGNMKADALALSGDTTAADNAESFFDGTGYAGTNNVIPTVTTLTGHTAQTGDSFARIGATGSGLTTLATQASVNTIDDFLDTEIAGIKAKTDLIPGTIDGKTYSELVTLIAAALLGKASGLATTTAVYRAVDDSKDRVTATVDSSGNRSAVTLDAA
jgi:hypothetical protein